MKNILLLLVAGVAGVALAQVDNAKVEIRSATPVLKPVRSYKDVLRVLPKEMEPESARNWSQAEREAANGIFKKKLLDTNRAASFRFKVQGIDAWPGVTVWAELPADEGYPVRLFVGLWKEPHYVAKVATLKPGDLIEMNGIVDAAKFENLWHKESLTICLREASFNKLEAKSEAAPSTVRVPLNIISAVYGSGDKFADLTDRVKAFIHEPGAVFAAKPHWLGADPTVGWNKALVIVYESEGKRRLFSCGEGGEVSSQILLK